VQGIIGRMAANSASCKNYCVSLVVGVLALGQVQQYKALLYLAYVPILMLGLLDAYYLSLERYFKEQFKAFVADWHTDTLKHEHLFVICPFDKKSKGLYKMIRACGSYSIFPFYGALLLIVFWLGKFT
jgi:hypothetical protein